MELEIILKNIGEDCRNQFSLNLPVGLPLLPFVPVPYTMSEVEITVKQIQKIPQKFDIKKIFPAWREFLQLY